MDQVKIMVPVFFINDGEYVTAYCPFLELSGYGVDQQDAMRSFEECMNMFIEDAIEKGNLHEILKQLGWELQEDDGPIFGPPPVPPHFSHLLPRSQPENRVFEIPSYA